MRITRLVICVLTLTSIAISLSGCGENKAEMQQSTKAIEGNRKREQSEDAANPQ